MSVRIPLWLREKVRERAHYCCEYCGMHEEDASLPHEPDHIVASQHGGHTTFENLAFSCFHCNCVKGPNLSSIDPVTNEITPLFNPRLHSWNEHFEIQQALIFPRTPTGRVTVNLLRLNTEERIAVRTVLSQAGLFPRVRG